MRAYTSPSRREQYMGMAWGILFISTEAFGDALERITRQVSTLSFLYPIDYKPATIRETIEAINYI